MLFPAYLLNYVANYILLVNEFWQNARQNFLAAYPWIKSLVWQTPNSDVEISITSLDHIVDDSLFITLQLVISL
jgi:hypothetical protein